MKRFILPLAAMCLTAASPLYAAERPDDIQQTNIFHAFDWTFAQLIGELPNIAEAGYGAIQVSPVQGNCANGAEWFYAYLPADFAFSQNGNGSRSNLKTLCTKAEDYGIKIIVDVVANHINPRKGYRNAWWEEGDRLRNTGSVNYNNRYSITHGNLGEYQDVNSESAEVQERAKAFLEDLKSIGVKGIRWDAAKHIGLPSEDCDFWAKMAEVTGLWHYGEILDNPGTNSDSEWNVMKEYTQYMSVTDNGLPSKQLGQLRYGRMAPWYEGDAVKAGVAKNKIILWGESHDTYANESGATKNIDQDVIDRVYLMNACRLEEGALYFSRPAKSGYAEIKMGVKGSTNGLTNPAIKAVNNFRLNNVGIEEAIAFKYGTGGWFANARKNSSVFITLDKKEARDIEATNPEGFMPEGTYTDYVSGGTFTVTADKIIGHVGEHGVAVLYVTDPSAVTEIDTDDADAPEHWFDLMGRPVTNPERGIFIRVKGSRSEKIML